MIKPSSRCSTRVVSGPEIMYRRGRGYAPASLALVSHSHDILLHDWGIQTIHKCQLRPMPQGRPPREAKLNKVNAWVNLNLCLCHKVFISSRVAISASLALVAHIHTPPLHEKGGSRPSTQAPGTAYGRPRGGAKAGVVNQSCLYGWSKSVPLCPFHLG